MPLLLCTDLDRTLLPNGPQAESPGARSALWEWVRRTGSRLAFVSGRRLALHLEAVAKYHLPMPDHLIADVGATIYDRGPEGEWAPNAGWHQLLAKSWQGHEWQDVLPLVSDLDELVLQEESEQAAHKLSFNVPDLRSRERVLTIVRRRLDEAFIKADLIWSVDETVPMGLLDVMAKGATKLDAVRWLVQSTGTAPDRVLYAGDSGNDIPVLASEIPAVLVANATDEVRAEALHLSLRNGHPEKLYLAKGILSGMNGCYAAGILEGLAHFFPDASGESLE